MMCTDEGSRYRTDDELKMLRERAKQLFFIFEKRFQHHVGILGWSNFPIWSGKKFSDPPIILKNLKLPKSGTDDWLRWCVIFSLMKIIKFRSYYFKTAYVTKLKNIYMKYIAWRIARWGTNILQTGCNTAVGVTIRVPGGCARCVQRDRIRLVKLKPLIPACAPRTICALGGARQEILATVVKIYTMLSSLFVPQ